MTHKQWFEPAEFCSLNAEVMGVPHLDGLSLARPVLSALCQGIKALRGVDSASNAFWEEAPLAVFGSQHQNVQVLQ